MGGLGIQVVTGGQFTATLDDPGHLTRFGARVEVPVTRAVVAAWQTATLEDGLWSVTLDAPLTDGFYNLVWRTVEEPPAYEAFIPLESVATLEASLTWPLAEDNRDDVTPELEDVAKLIPTRTVNDGMVEQGTFNDETRPTEDQATALIDQAVDDVLVQLRDEFDPRLYPQVKRAVAFYSAMLIERSFYPSDVGDPGGALPWQAEYREALAGVTTRIEDDNVMGVAPLTPVLS